MKHLSLKLLAGTVAGRRKALKLSQAALSERTGINRSILSRLEAGDYSPSVDQLLALSTALGFPTADVIVDDEAVVPSVTRQRIAVAGTGYVGLSLAVLLSQHNDVVAVDVLPEKVEKLRRWESPIQDEYIEKYLAEHEQRGLSLTATTDAASAYASADFIIVAANLAKSINHTLKQKQIKEGGNVNGQNQRIGTGNQRPANRSRHY